MTFLQFPNFPSKALLQSRWTARETQLFDLYLQNSVLIHSGLLMENAGYFLSQTVLALISNRPSHILFLVGPGNNGGDGLVAARHLYQISNITASVFAPLGLPTTRNTPARDAAEVVSNLHLPISSHSSADLACTDLVVDCLFGVGLTRPVTGVAAEALEWASSIEAPILAVDCPSGLDSTTGQILGTALPAQHTLSYIGPKAGFYLEQGPATCGKIQLAPIGVSAELALRWLKAHRRAPDQEVVLTKR